MRSLPPPSFFVLVVNRSRFFHCFLYGLLPLVDIYVYICYLQATFDKRLASWHFENEKSTREACNVLLKQLKEQHLDPVLAQLHGEEGARVSFEDIIQGYKGIEEDYKVRAIGAKDVCATMFFEFHPVTTFLIIRSFQLKHTRDTVILVSLTPPIMSWLNQSFSFFLL